jgi:hypothetical protein
MMMVDFRDLRKDDDGGFSRFEVGIFDSFDFTVSSKPFDSIFILFSRLSPKATYSSKTVALDREWKYRYAHYYRTVEAKRPERRTKSYHIYRKIKLYLTPIN